MSLAIVSLGLFLFNAVQSTIPLSAYPAPEYQVPSDAYPAPSDKQDTSNTLFAIATPHCETIDPPDPTVEQSLIDPCITPTPLPTGTPTPIANGIPIEWSVVVVTTTTPFEPDLPLPDFGSIPTYPAPADIPVGWSVLFSQNFNDPTNLAPCTRIEDRNYDGYDRTWGIDTNPSTPLSQTRNAMWPARGGINSVNPSLGYPPNLKTWQFCASFNIVQADKLKISFLYRSQIDDPDDKFRLYVGTVDNMREIINIEPSRNTNGEWRLREVDVEFNVNNPAPFANTWFGLWFESDGDNFNGEGIWISEITVLQYREPEQVCGASDTGPKGINLPAFDPRVGEVPIIRVGDTTALNQLDHLRTDWVRLLFKLPEGAQTLDLEAYDYIIDNLCDRGISVLGLVNDESLLRCDFQTNMDGYKGEYAPISRKFGDVL